MRGIEHNQTSMFSYVVQEDRIPQHHPMRKLKAMVDPLLVKMSRDFTKMYADGGRPSIPPECLLRASLVQVLYSIRSERLLMEELDYNFLFRWFVGLTIDEKAWDHSVFSKNRERLLEADIATKFLHTVLALAEEHQLLSDEHFSVDGTIIEAWASQKSFVKKTSTPPSEGSGKNDPPSSSSENPGNPMVNFRGEKRSNETHQSTTDPESRLYTKGTAKHSKLSYLGHLLMENRHGLAVEASYTIADGYAEREQAVEMTRKVVVNNNHGRKKKQRTVGGDKWFDTKEVVAKLRALHVTPHVAQNTSNNRPSAIDERTTRHQGYQESQRRRKRIEEIFGWLKTVGLMRKTRFKGLKRGGWMFTFAVAAYNLVRIRTILSARTG